MIRLDAVTVTYTGHVAPTLHDVDLSVAEGELVLVTGATGSGKSTLLRCLNGLVPHFSGGRLDGRVVVAGRDTRTNRPRDLADIVGYVGQDPQSGFVTDLVEDELAYGMESLSVAPTTMRRRVEETLDLLGLAHLRARPLLSLSAGEQQRVAIGAVLTAHPQLLVLDEPTSALDPGGAEDVLAAITRLVHDLGLTVVVAEHRLERVVHYADVLVHVDGAGGVTSGAPVDMLADTVVAPAVVRLGRLAGWSPLPLSVRDARRRSGELISRLGDATPPSAIATSSGADVVARTRRLDIEYDGIPALRGVDLELRAGEITALMGRNGAGKSTLLACIAGLRAPGRGEVEVLGDRTHGRDAREVIKRVGLVPQEPADLLWSSTVRDECVAADRDGDAAPGTTATLLARLAPAVDAAAHPRDLSEGERLSLVLAIALSAAPRLLLLDEPTRGLDYVAKQRLVVALRGLAGTGHAVVLATHDVELAAEVADRVVILADGEVVADGPAGDVVLSSPVFAPQVAKILAPARWLTVDDVEAALAR